MLKVIVTQRETDNYGSGAYLAQRGDRLHKGIDLACYPKSLILPIKAGIVTKIGFPYDLNDSKKGHLRYVQITDNEGIDARYFYINPLVTKGDVADTTCKIGSCQDLQEIYPGITNHIHFEVKKDGEYLDPIEYIIDALEAKNPWIT